jgi:hypothetical protein
MLHGEPGQHMAEQAADSYQQIVVNELTEPETDELIFLYDLTGLLFNGLLATPLVAALLPKPLLDNSGRIYTELGTHIEALRDWKFRFERARQRTEAWMNAPVLSEEELQAMEAAIEYGNRPITHTWSDEV